MQQHPDASELLEAMAAFLTEDIRPRIDDASPRFRVLIAANLARQIAAERREAPQLRADERERLVALLGREADDPRTITELDAELADGVRAGRTDPDAARRHLMDTLAAWLRTVDPRYDLRIDID